MNLPFTPGTLVQITGARTFTGTFVGGNDLMLLVALDPHNTVTLRRDPASTAPDQWRYGGLPVAIRATGTNREFTERLRRLVERTRQEEEAREHADPDDRW